MKRIVLASLLLLALGGAYLLGAWSKERGASQDGRSAARTVLYYVDPMHPAYKSDKPGIAPDCGMELVPVYADGSMGSGGSGAGVPPGTVRVNPERQQLVGVKVAAVEKAPRRHTLRVLGRVVPDETRIYRINAATDGWVKKILSATTDSLVRQDELLATFYAPEFFSAMKAYLYGLRSMERFEAGRKESKEQIETARAGLENYRNALRNLGMTEHQLDEILRTREGADQVEIRAPAAGFILIRNLSLGQRFERGTELYRIADLAKVWIVAETFATDATAFAPGMQVRVFAPNLRKTFAARVAQVPPRFDPTTRALQVRLEADNPEYALRPDMFVDLELPITLPPAIVVPAEALVDSGIRQTVFVEREAGVFEPRQVTAGWRSGDQVEILQGLAPGERIVVSGTFLLDSESRMKAAAAAAVAPGHEGHAHPAAAQAGATTSPAARVKDPICGMDVDIAKAKAAGLTATYQGKQYYFCSLECRQQFAKDPKRYAAAPN